MQKQTNLAKKDNFFKFWRQNPAKFDFKSFSELGLIH